MKKNTSTARHDQSAPVGWSNTLVWAGFGLLICCEIMAGVGAFHTANRSVLIFGLPVDALGKVAIASVVGLGAYGGAMITAWLWASSYAAHRKLAKIALAATVALFAMAVWNQAAYFGWARRMHEHPQVAQSQAYAQALQDHAATSARLTGEPMGYEEEAVVLAAQQRAAAIIKKGQAPTGSEAPGFMDWLKAFAVYSIIELMAAGFRIPQTPQRQNNKARGKGRAQRPRNENVVALRN